MDDYIDVPARIALFAAKYPEGSLQGDGYFVRDVEEKIVGYHYVARAYRTAADERPGVGTAYEPIPGKTPYTRDSEVMNAETSAWGRAIVALGFETKKIASAEEVRARQKPVEEPKAAKAVPQAEVHEPASSTGTSFPIPDGIKKVLPEQTPPDSGLPQDVVVHFGKNASKRLGELSKNSVKWYAENELRPDATPADRRLKGAAQTLLELS
jgi:hypothetical protein